MTSNAALRALVFRWTLLGAVCLFGCIVVGVSISTGSVVRGLVAAFEALLLSTVVIAGALSVGAAVERSARRNFRRVRRYRAGRNDRRSPVI